jgi:hypothetical protein
MMNCWENLLIQKTAKEGHLTREKKNIFGTQHVI